MGGEGKERRERRKRDSIVESKKSLK